MALLSRLFPPGYVAPSRNGNGAKARAPELEVKQTPFLPGFIPLDALGKTLDVRLSTERAMIASVLCYAAITYRMQKVSEAPLMVVDETDEGEPWIEDHPLAGVLMEPNADQEMADLIEETHLSLDLTGKSLWLKQEGRVRSIAPVARLQHFRGDEFRVEATPERLYGRFIVQTSRGEREYKPEEVVFFRLPHPTKRHEGLSPTDVALSRLGIEAQLIESIKNGLINSVVPSLGVEFAGSLTPEQRAEYKASLSAGHASALHTGKPFVTEGGATLKQFSLSLEGLAGGALYREVEAAVCIAFKVRPEILAFMIGLENAPWSHMQTAQRLTYDEAIIPLWRRWERTLTRQLLRPVDPDKSHLIRFDTSKVRALQADQEQNARVQLLLRGVATRNQRRQIAGLEPEESDPDFWDAVEAPAAPAFPGAEPVKTRAGRLEAKKVDDQAVRWMVFDEVTRAQEFGWQLAAAEQLHADRAAVLKIIRSRAKAGPAPRSRKDDDPFAPNPVGADEVRAMIREIAEHLDLNSTVQWRGRVEALTEATARRAVERLALEIGVSFDLLQPGLLEYVQREAAWLVQEVTGVTKQGIRDALSAGLVEGEGVDQLATRIEELGAFSPSRAELIARTETTRVTNGGQRETLEAYQKESGEKITKTWLSARDARVRDEHRELDGETRPLGEPFSNGLQAPGEPNCRCTLVYAMEAS